MQRVEPKHETKLEEVQFLIAKYDDAELKRQARRKAARKSARASRKLNRKR